MANIEMPPVKSRDSSGLGVSAPEQQLHLTRPSLNGNETSSTSASDKKYTCHHYASKVLQNWNFLRQKTICCDVEIVVGGRVMKAHRALLSASSQYFQAMFTTGYVEEQRGRIEFHDIPPHILSSLIDFIYTDEININQDNVQDLIVAADMLELKEVVVGCTEFLKHELDATNAIGIYRFAEGYNCEKLANVAVEFIHLHFPQISNEEEFLELPKELLTKFLSSEHLRVETEFQVFQAAMGWITHDVRRRRRYMYEILSHVRLPLLSLRLLGQAVCDCREKSLKGLIYIVGGRTHSSPHEQDLLSFNPVTGEWSALPPMLVPRSHMGVAVLDGYLYVVGGSNRHRMVLQSVERYSFEEKKWSEVSPMKVGRSSFAVASADGLLYVIGGQKNICDEQQTISCVECYDPLADKWHDCPPLPDSRSDAAAIVV